VKILILNGSPHLDGPTSDMARQNKSEKKRKELYRFGKNI
jgi:hypothetical protein